MTSGTPSERGALLMALAGIVGPAGFILAWVVAGALTPGYSWVDDAISRLAASGAPHRALMTTGFVCFGVAVPAYAVVLRRRLAGRAWVAAAASGVTTLGVALFSLGRSSSTDDLHNAMASLGYVALVATPLLAAHPLVEARHRRAGVASLAVAGLAGVCLVATLLGPAHGLAQRAGLTVVDLWLMTGAATITMRSGWAPRRASQAHRSARN